jgi:hypothetical protein
VFTPYGGIDMSFKVEDKLICVSLIEPEYEGTIWTVVSISQDGLLRCTNNSFKSLLLFDSIEMIPYSPLMEELI